MRIVVLTGAGISAESGIPTFRGKDGLWNKFRPQDLATPSAFERDPVTVWKWYDWRRQIIAKAEPNEGHRIIARMEQEFDDFYLITQNVDGLHQRAGSKKVIELHGNIWTLRCTSCSHQKTDYRAPLPEIPPSCERCGALMRPGVVWFGESLPEDALNLSMDLSRSADIFVVVGTSATVYPAAQLPILARSSGAKLVEVNPQETDLTSYADLSVRKKASDGLREVLEFIYTN